MSAAGPGNWLAVAAAAHVRRGRAGGFMQVCHGKAAPLRRLKPGDRIAYYSPSEQPGQRDGLQAFTAIGLVAEGAVVQVVMAPGFQPWRRRVAWLAAQEVSIRPLLARLDLTAAGGNWGYRLRFGLLPIGAVDMARIAESMGVVLPFG